MDLMDLAGAPAVFIVIAVAAIGLCVGSFLNVAIYRLPREGLGLSTPRRSFCPACLAPISARDNVPVLSWLILRGRCRSCRTPIPFRYPFVEIVCGLLSLLVFRLEGPTLGYLCYFYFACCLVAIALIDLELMVIPDALVRPAMLVAGLLALASPRPPLAGRLIWAFLADSGLSDKLLNLSGAIFPSLADIGWRERLISLALALLAGLLGYLALWLPGRLYKLLKGRKGLGEGDPPLLGMIAMFLGLTSILPILLLSSLLGLASVGILLGSGRLKGDSLGARPIPFGPFLSLAALVWLFFGRDFLPWYLSLMLY